MQTATCSIRISEVGSALTNIVRRNVTPAEAVLFRHQKGPDAVVIVGDVDEVKRPYAEERDRLLIAHRQAFQECFPGSGNVLPLRFEDIGLECPEDGDDKPLVRNNRGRKAKKADAEDPGEDDDIALGVD